MKKIEMTAARIAEIVGGVVYGDGNRVIDAVEGIRHAGKRDLSFVSHRRMKDLLNSSQAGIVLVCKELASEDTSERTLISVDNVDIAFSKVLTFFAEEPPEFERTIHPTAVVATDAKIGANVAIGPNAVIEAGVEIGDGSVIGAGCYIGHQVKIGKDNLIYPNVTIMYRCIIGNKNIIHPGVVIGADGFGFMPSATGLVKIPQTGIVQICDDVEIGANTTIDRARFGRTLIKSNVKIDDQVMVGHNVTIGESSILVAQCGIAGSAELGRGVIVAAKAGVNGHISIGDGSQIAGMSGAQKSLPPNSIALGLPAENQRDFMTRLTLPGRVERLSAKVEKLKTEIDELKNK